MISTLRDSKARLSELVERASKGEDVLITVRGKIKARLTAAGTEMSAQDREAWLDRLKRLQERIGTGRTGKPIEEILDEIREDRI